jgi:hypothetical protein
MFIKLFWLFQTKIWPNVKNKTALLRSFFGIPQNGSMLLLKIKVPSERRGLCSPEGIDYE